MSAANRGEGGVPRRAAALPRSTRGEEQWKGANQEKDEKLRLKRVQRRAGEDGLALRHSDYGYALIGAGRKSVNGRNDMSLKEIESWLDGARQE